MRVRGGYFNDFVLRVRTSSRTIKKVNTEMFNKIKKTFKALVKDEFVSIHGDEKLFPDGRDFTAFEHITVLSSHHNGTKLLGTTSPKKETGKNQAEAIKNILHDWELVKQSVATCFDTTASNTGKFHGACIHSEALLNYPLLWTPCCHHMQEVILSHVFKSIFGKSSSSQIMFFEILKKNGTLLTLL